MNAQNAKRAILWAALFAVAGLLIVAGFQGSLGRMLAVFTSPADLTVNTKAS